MHGRMDALRREVKLASWQRVAAVSALGVPLLHVASLVAPHFLVPDPPHSTSCRLVWADQIITEKSHGRAQQILSR